MKKFILFCLSVVFLSPMLIAGDSDGNGLTWPKEIDKNGTKVILYQPQLESLDGNILPGRMALSFTPKGEEEILGALGFKARISANYDTHTTILEKLDITMIHLPGITDSIRIERFGKLLTQEIESWDMVMSLDRMLASLEDAKDMKEMSVKINNKPPDIYFRIHPAVLITIDGDPIIKEVQQQCQNFNRSYQNRSRGAASYNRARSAGSYGGARGRRR